MGINTIGDLASTPAQLLARHFGRATGKALKMHSLGVDNTPIVTHWEPKSMGREVTFERDTGDRKTILLTLKALLLDTVKRLRKGRYRGRTVTVKVRYRNFLTITRSRTLPRPTDSLSILSEVATSILERIELDRPVRLVGVRVSRLSKGIPSKT